MTFGNPFGLALYDKQQREVTGAAGGGDRSSAGQASRPRPTPLRVVPQAPAPPMARPQGMEAQLQAHATSSIPPSTAVAQRPARDPGLAPLDPATIRQLHATIRTLPAPVLDGFTKAFRKRFQVPAEAASIADRICQSQHHDWIEAFLVQHQDMRNPAMVIDSDSWSSPGSEASTGQPSSPTASRPSV